MKFIYKFVTKIAEDGFNPVVFTSDCLLTDEKIIQAMKNYAPEDEYKIVKDETYADEEFYFSEISMSSDGYTIVYCGYNEIDDLNKNYKIG